MGKKKVITKGGEGDDKAVSQSQAKTAKRRIEHGILYIRATYNNTAVSLTDDKGNVLLWSTSGAMGYKGAKKGTPFAAGKVGDVLAEKAAAMGLKEVDVVVRGVGSGRESSIRAFTAKGIGISSIQDKTPIPFNGPKPKKPRRV